MRAEARLSTELTHQSGGPGSRISTLRSEAPLMLRLTMAKDPEPWTNSAANIARASVASGAAGPIGGDEFALDVQVGAGSTLVLNEISPTLLLPGPEGAQSRMDTTIRVESGATFIWLPEPIIASAQCDHINTIHVELEPGARLLIREELLLGRCGEAPGRISQQVRVNLNGRPLYHQRLDLGEASTGWDSAAVTGGHSAVGAILAVDPLWDDSPPDNSPFAPEAALMALDGPAALISALAGDSLDLRRDLETGLDLLGSGWRPHTTADNSLTEPEPLSVRSG